jgi:hypothetical protein
LVRQLRITAFLLMGLAATVGVRAKAQAALLMEEPYGFFWGPESHRA